MAGTLAAFAAVHSGVQAHGPVERIPGARTQLRVGILRATAQQAAGDRDAARTTLEVLKTQFPDNVQVQRRLAELAK